MESKRVTVISSVETRINALEENPVSNNSLAQKRSVNLGASTTKKQQIPLFPSFSSSQRVSLSSNDNTLNRRKKVVLEFGCSPLDWAKLTSSGSNLKGICPVDFPLRVTKEVLKQHNTQTDCWTVLSGKVYNITPYIRFHPGGKEEIMKCAGKDGTSLFKKYHAWVNYERMLESCWVGIYIV